MGRIGSTIRDMRKARRWSSTHLAALSGIERSSLSSIESGARNPSTPVLARIAKALGTTPGALVAQSEGLIVVHPGGGDTISGVIKVPVVGTVSRGRNRINPSLTQVPPQEIRRGVYVNRELIDPGSYAVKIRGASMAPALRDGDTAFVSPRARIRSEDDVLLYIDNETAYCGRIHPRGPEMILAYSNPSFPPECFEKSKIVKLHKVVGVLRKR